MESIRANLDGYHDPSTDLERHLAARTAANVAEARSGVRLASKAELAALQQHIRDVVDDGIGGHLAPTSAPVGAEAAGAIETERYLVERLLLKTRTGVTIPTNLYVPTGPAPAAGRPAVVFLCGHYVGGKAHDDYQRAAGAFASAGYVVAVFDPHGLGERRSYDEIPAGTAEHTYAGLQCWWWGVSPARYFVDDARRVIDYLSSRDDVDAGRIVAMGSSGGGMLTTLLMVLDPRLAGAAPATYLTSRAAYLPTGGAQDAEQILLGASAAGFEHDWLLAAMAPKPVMVLAADSDFFPIEGTLDSVAAARQAWQIHDSDDRLALYRADCTHRLHPDMADAAVAFFNQHLGHDGVGTPAAEIQPQAEDALLCTTSGRVGGATIHDRLLTDLPSLETDRDAAVAWLRGQVEAGRAKTPLQVRSSGSHRFWQSEPGIWNCAITDAEPVSRVVLSDAGTREAHGFDDDVSTMVLDVRGRGQLTPRERTANPTVHHAFAAYKHLSDLLWLGDSLAARQVFDVLRALDHFASDDVELVGRGYGAYLARLVAALRPVRLTVEDEFVDPVSTQRLWDEGRGGWQGIIPGLATRWKLFSRHM